MWIHWQLGQGVSSTPNVNIYRGVTWTRRVAARAECRSIGTRRSRWTTASCCAPTCSGRSAAGSYPVILSYGPYAKGLAFQEGYKGNWARLIKAAPEVLQGSSNKYQNWELVDPEKWVPDGYACVRVDSRGAGRSPGYLDIWSPRETQDIYALRRMGRHAAVVATARSACNGISYYAMNQWQVARAASRRISPRSASGKARPTTTASCAATAASSSDFLVELVSAPGASRAARRRRARREERGHRRAGGRAARR